MPKTAPDGAQVAPVAEDIPPRVRTALAEAGLLLSSFRWKLAKAGYPFAEPPGVQRLIVEIDSLMFPDERKAKK